MTLKRCFRCGVEKELDKFSPDQRRTFGVASSCRECINLDGAAHAKAWRERNPDATRITNLRKMGLTVEQYEERLEAQGGVCAICKQPPPTEKRLCVDHDHNCCPGVGSCGACVRGLLCDTCNTRLAWFEKFAREATDYMDSFELSREAASLVVEVRTD